MNIATSVGALLCLSACSSPTVLPDAGTVTDAGAPVDAGPPSAPWGYDAYRRWGEWPALRWNVRAVMQSTHDRRGGNEGVDASHYYRRDAHGLSVPLDLHAPGVLYFARFNHWHGSPWTYTVDDVATVVTESSTADPDHPVDGSVFLPTDAFPSPLARTWSETRGADLSWVPIPFARSLTLGYGRTHYGTGYAIAHVFPEGTAIPSWDVGAPPADVLALAGSDAESLVPPGLATDTGTVDVPASGAVIVADLVGPARVRALVLEVASADADALAGARLRITWDGRAAPSVDAPVALFFGSASVADVRAFPVAIHVLPTTVRFTTVFPMPYSSSAHVELVGNGAAARSVRWTIGREARASTDGGMDGGTADGGTVDGGTVGGGTGGGEGSDALFHAFYRDHGSGVAGADLVLLDTTEQEGETDWCGSFVGTTVAFTDTGRLDTLEGDPRFFFDDAESPQAQGTGSEEWGGGGDYWGGQTMTMPFVGHPVGNSLYRFLLADLFPFGRNARIQLEHGGMDESVEHYRSVVYWYGVPGACLVRTDSLQVGDLGSESAHGYVSPDASAPETIVSAWDVGVVAPTSTDVGRHTTGTSDFTLALDPANVGVLLRRKLDYQFPDQRADVYVADATPGATFAHAGIWMSPGATTALYSNPPTETGAPETTLVVSDRRFREEELLLPPRLTAGRSAILVRVVFAPTHVPVTPETALAPEAWSELRYDAYCYRAR